MKVTINLKSTITCPFCSFKKEEVMPVNACLLVYVCDNCNESITAEEDTCCVFCTHGSIPCPSVQQQNFLFGPNQKVSKL